MSEYIRLNKFDTNECPNVFVNEKFVPTNVWIYICDQYIRHTLPQTDFFLPPTEFFSPQTEEYARVLVVPLAWGLCTVQFCEMVNDYDYV